VRRAVRLTGCGFDKKAANIVAFPAAVADLRKYANRSNISRGCFAEIAAEFE
jgi:hypothetical protein